MGTIHHSSRRGPTPAPPASFASQKSTVSNPSDPSRARVSSSYPAALQPPRAGRLASARARWATACVLGPRQRARRIARGRRAL